MSCRVVQPTWRVSVPSMLDRVVSTARSVFDRPQMSAGVGQPVPPIGGPRSVRAVRVPSDPAEAFAQDAVHQPFIAGGVNGCLELVADGVKLGEDGARFRGDFGANLAADLREHGGAD